MTLGCHRQLTSSTTHMCVWGHSSNWSAKVGCSEPSHDFLIRLLCNTHVSVHSSNWSANPQLTSSATQVRMCSQQQSVCQSFNLELTKLELTGSALDMCVFRNTHMCMPPAANSRPALDPWVQPSFGLFCLTHVCVCSQQQLVCQRNVQNLHLASPSDESATHMCVFTAANGRPTLS